MTIWQRILQGVTALVSSTGISMLTGIVSAWLTFRYLTPQDYGRLALFLSYYNTGTIFLTLGIEGIITSEVARARGEQRWAWIRKMIQLYATLVLGTGAGLFAVFAAISQFSSSTTLWLLMGLYLLLTAPNRVLSILFHGTTRYRRLASLTVVRSASRAGLLLLLPVWWRDDLLTGVALTFPLLELCVLITALWLLRHAWRELALEEAGTPSYSAGDFWQLFKGQSAYAILSVPVKTVAEQFPVWFLRAMVGETAVGLYSAAQRTYFFILSLFRSIETILFPLVAEQMGQHMERLRVALRQAQKYTFWLGLFAIITTTFAARWIILLIAGEAYLRAVPILRIICWHLLFFALSQGQRPIFFANRAQRWLFLTYALGAAIGAATYPLAIVLFAEVGAGIGFLFYNCAVIVARQGLTRTYMPDFYVSPRTIFQIEPFDHILFDAARKRATRWLGKQ